MITWRTAILWTKYFLLSPLREPPITRAIRKCLLLMHSFPEVLAIQVSRLVSKMKEELGGDAESPVREQLREKITALSQSQLPRAADILAMIWNGVMGPLDLPTPEPKPPFFVKPTRFVNWHRVKLALLKSIPTGTFIDVQFFAYNAIDNDLPVDPRPLYTSAIVIERWGAAIMTRKLEPSSKFTQL